MPYGLGGRVDSLGVVVLQLFHWGSIWCLSRDRGSIWCLFPDFLGLWDRLYYNLAHGFGAYVQGAGPRLQRRGLKIWSWGIEISRNPESNPKAQPTQSVNATTARPKPYRANRKTLNCLTIRLEARTK